MTVYLSVCSLQKFKWLDGWDDIWLVGARRGRFPGGVGLVPPPPGYMVHKGDILDHPGQRRVTQAIDSINVTNYLLQVTFRNSIGRFNDVLRFFYLKEQFYNSGHFCINLRFRQRTSHNLALLKRMCQRTHSKMLYQGKTFKYIRLEVIYLTVNYFSNKKVI